MSFNSELIETLIDRDWENIKHDKKLISNILNNIPDNNIFSSVYKHIQEKYSDSEVLYYLNPLQFKDRELLVLQIIKINNNLDYTGLIKSCHNRNIDTSLFLSRIS